MPDNAVVEPRKGRRHEIEERQAYLRDLFPRIYPETLPPDFCFIVNNYPVERSFVIMPMPLVEWYVDRHLCPGGIRSTHPAEWNNDMFTDMVYQQVTRGQVRGFHGERDIWAEELADLRAHHEVETIPFSSGPRLVISAAEALAKVQAKL